MTQSTGLAQPWQQFHDQIKSADSAAGKERPYRISDNDGNPYPASPSMRLDGGWCGPISTANKVRERKL